MINVICRLSGGDVPHGEGWNGDHPDPARQLDRQAGHAARRGHHPRSERPRGREQPPRPAGAAEGLQRQHHAEGAAQLQGRTSTSTGEGSQKSEGKLWSTEGGMRRNSRYFSRLTCGISGCQAFENWAQMGSINNTPHTLSGTCGPLLTVASPYPPPYSNTLAPQLKWRSMYVRQWPLDWRVSDGHIPLLGYLASHGSHGHRVVTCKFGSD